MKKHVLTFSTLLALMVFTTGCEHGINLTGTVTVAPELQANFTLERPGVVYFRADIPKTAPVVYTLGTLCGASDSERVFEVNHDGFGCAKEGTVAAWVEWAGDDASGLSCDMAPVPGEVGAGESERVGESEAVVFLGKGSEGGCESGAALFDLAIAAQ